MADDAKALVDRLGISGFHLMGVSMGGMIAQEYAIAYPGDLKSLTLACTYGKADPFCQTMFAMWADIAKKISVPFVMRDVALWAFTGPFFEERPGDAAEFAAAMAALDMSLEAYLAQLSVIQTHDASDRLGQIKVPTLVLAGEEDILIPVRLSKKLQAGHPRLQMEDRSRRTCLHVGNARSVQRRLHRFRPQCLSLDLTSTKEGTPCKPY